MDDLASGSSTLRWDTLITGRPSLSRDTPAGHDDLKWVPNTATLLFGERDAVLIDTFLTIEASRQLVDWVVKSGKNLTAVYVTHAHGDHFFGLPLVKEQFPNARLLARSEVVTAMKSHIAPESMDNFWNKLFPGQIADPLLVADTLPNDAFELEGHKLVPISVGHTDTNNTTCLYVPSVGVVIAGDAVYNHVYPYLAETDATGRAEWIAALDKIEALDPRVVIAGHKAPGTEDGPAIIKETRNYLRDFGRVSETAADAHDIYNQMLALYPGFLNPGSLWSAAKAAKPAS